MAGFFVGAERHAHPAVGTRRRLDIHPFKRKEIRTLPIHSPAYTGRSRKILCAEVLTGMQASFTFAI
ncbi:hypothetical protein [Rudaea sp.]|uniref:hypothetical protein n=1 Tax=Rudaea sp. TaxID=2136325 RepID=UPI0037837239